MTLNLFNSNINIYINAKYTQYASKFGKLSSGHRIGKGQFSFQTQRKASQRVLKLLHNCTHLHASKVMLKILQARLQQYVNCKLPDVQAVFRKEEPEIKLPTSIVSSKKQKSSRKTSISALLTMPKPLTVWITINCGKFFKRWKYQTILPASWEICMQVKKQHLDLDMRQQTGSKLGKEYIKAVYCHLAYLSRKNFIFTQKFTISDVLSIWYLSFSL